ncbi:hypothetical protein CR513_02347, partial [Mucuna pruriens]
MDVEIQAIQFVVSSAVNLSTQINSISMLNETNFKVWTEVVVIILGYMDLHLALQVEKSTPTLDKFQEVKLEKWERSKLNMSYDREALDSRSILGALFLRVKGRGNIYENT